MWATRLSISSPRLHIVKQTIYQAFSAWSSCSTTASPSLSQVRTSSTMSTGEKPVEVLLVGLGSMGSVYAHILEKTGRARITAVARSNYALYTEQGVTIDKTDAETIENWRPYKVVKSQEEALSSGQVYDYCLLTTKCLPDILPNSQLLAPALASDQIKAYALIQNGLDIEKDIYAALKERGQEEKVPIVSGAAWIGLMTSPDGKRIIWAGPRGGGLTAIGAYPPPAQNPSTTAGEKGRQAAIDFAKLLEEGGHSVEVTERMDAVRYQKNVWNCTWSSVEGLTRATPEFFAYLPKELQQQVKLLIREIVGVGFGTGLLETGAPLYPLGGKIGTEEEQCNAAWDVVTALSLEKVNAGQASHRMSLLIDVEMGRPIEAEVIVGAVVRIAKKHDIPVPLLEYTYALLKALQGHLAHQQELKRKA